MGKGNKHIGFLMALLLLLAGVPVGTTSGQNGARINFGSYGDFALDVYALEDFLEFGQIIGSGGDVIIGKTDDRAVIIEITGVANLDVTVTLLPPPDDELKREGDLNTGIPVDIKMAYYNQGEADEPIILSQSVEVTGQVITFPIRRSTGGPPGPPPTPPHSAYTPPTAKAYIVIYGTLLVGGQTLYAGNYNGIITVDVAY
ncbi:MAG: hypothetical protein R6U86_05155 [Bacteroidales bacterium]